MLTSAAETRTPARDWAPSSLSRAGLSVTWKTLLSLSQQLRVTTGWMHSCLPKDVDVSVRTAHALP